MNWSAVTAIVDTVGLAVIVISLLYISRQTKQAKDHAAAASEIDYMDGVSRIFNEWASDEHTADIIRKGFAAFDELSKAEQALFD